MATTAKRYGVQASFAAPALNSGSLGAAITSLSSSLTETRTEMTELGGKTQRTVRDVLRVSVDAESDSQITNEWFYYSRSFKFRRNSDGHPIYDRSGHRMCGSDPLRPTDESTAGQMADVFRRWSDETDDFETIPFTPGAHGVALKEKFFGEGAERLVAKFSTVGPSGKFIGTPLVAKSSRFLDIAAPQIEYHKEFCRT